MTISTTPRRWLLLTPDRCVIGLVGLEGLLFLSGRFIWFPFNEHKGWTVLIAVASIGAAILLMVLWFVVALILRREFQFSIRSLLLLTVAVAIPSGWLAVEMRKARRQKEAVEWNRSVSSYAVVYDFMVEDTDTFVPIGQPLEPEWLRNLLGVDFFADIFELGHFTQITDAGLEHLKELPHLHVLRLNKTPITDAGLNHLKALNELRILDISSTHITNAGLGHLAGLTQLRVLLLIDTQITDAGLQHLQGLTQLQRLWLYGTHVSDIGLEHLRGLTQLTELSLGGTIVTDSGLKHLQCLSQLKQLWLNQTQVTDEGVQKLRQTLPNCGIASD